MSSRDSVSGEELRAFMLRQEAMTSSLYKMYRLVTGMDKGLEQVMNKIFIRALCPN